MLINSRYSLVLATSKRARQIIAGSEPMVEGAAGKKPLSIAIDELYKGKVKILEDIHEEEEVSAEAASENTEEVTAEAKAQEKPLSIAIDELYKGKVKILEDIHEEEEVSAEAASENTEEVTAEAKAQEA